MATFAVDKLMPAFLPPFCGSGYPSWQPARPSRAIAKKGEIERRALESLGNPRAETL